MVKGTKYMSNGGSALKVLSTCLRWSMKGTKYMAKGGAMKGTKYTSKGGKV